LIPAVVAALAPWSGSRSDRCAEKRAASCTHNSALRIASKSLTSQRTNATPDQGARTGTLILFARCAASDRHSQKRGNHYSGQTNVHLKILSHRYNTHKLCGANAAEERSLVAERQGLGKQSRPEIPACSFSCN
jgi:hypothetical protein